MAGPDETPADQPVDQSTDQPADPLVGAAAGDLEPEPGEDPAPDVPAPDVPASDGAGPDGDPGSATAGPQDRPVPRDRSRLVANALIALLCLALGIGVVTQVRHTRSGDALADQRPQDLVVLLDGLQQREAALRAEIGQAEATLRRLRANGDTSSAALDEARRRAASLAVLAGTVPVRGPGLELQISDPAGRLTPETMLDVLQELRGAGAEAMQIDAVRIGVNSSFSGTAGGVLVDGTPLHEQVRVLAVGDPPTLAAALNIPGGVVDTVRRGGGEVVLRQTPMVQITALRSIAEPQYARPTN